jgi:hypothetical protein
MEFYCSSLDNCGVNRLGFRQEQAYQVLEYRHLI